MWDLERHGRYVELVPPKWNVFAKIQMVGVGVGVLRLDLA